MDVCTVREAIEPRYHLKQRATASKSRKPTEGAAMDLAPGEAAGV